MTHGFVASPELATVYAITGTLDFDPEADELTAPDGSKFKVRLDVFVTLFLYHYLA